MLKSKIKIGATLSRYVLARVFIPLSLALFIILSALSLERLLRLIDIVTKHNAPIAEAARLLLYLQPHYLGLALPAALFLSIILAVRQMNDNSELVIIQAAGVPHNRLIFPVSALALALTVFMVFVTSYAQPHGRYQFRASLQDLTTQGETLRLQPGVFYHMGDDTTIRADMVGQRGQFFKGFFAQHVREDGTKQIVTAETAEIIETPRLGGAPGEKAGDYLNLSLSNARLVEIPEGRSPKIITTQSYPLSIETGAANALGGRGQDRRELTYLELLKGGVDGVMVENTRAQLFAEFHFRLVQTLSLPVLAILAIPLGLMGRGRTGKAAGIVVGVILLVLYEKTLGFAESFAAAGSVPALPALWLPWLALCFVTAMFMGWQTGYFERIRLRRKT